MKRKREMLKYVSGTYLIGPPQPWTSSIPTRTYAPFDKRKLWLLNRDMNASGPLWGMPLIFRENTTQVKSCDAYTDGLTSVLCVRGFSTLYPVHLFFSFQFTLRHRRGFCIGRIHQLLSRRYTFLPTVGGERWQDDKNKHPTTMNKRPTPMNKRPTPMTTIFRHPGRACIAVSLLLAGPIDNMARTWETHEAHMPCTEDRVARCAAVRGLE